MKRIFLFLSLACAVALSGCEKDLDQLPLSNGSVPVFYKSAADFDQAMTSVYSQLRGYPDREVYLSEVRSDNIYASSAVGGRDWDPINNFSTLLNINAIVADAWASDYATIYRANTILDQLAANGSVVPAALRTRYEGEAKFIRAFMYFDLVRKFGRVPVIEHALLPREVALIPRAEVVDVYKLIYRDLRTAIATLPVSYTGANVGRVTVGAAKGILAQVFLTRSGPDYGIKGPGLNSNEFARADSLLSDIIAARGTARYATQATYAGIFAPTAENNSEVIFDIQYFANGTVGGSFQNIVVPDGYYTQIGLAFSAGSVEIKPCSNDLVNTYTTADLRKAFNIQLGFSYVSGATTISDTRPFFKKYVNVAAKGASRTDWGLNYIVLRYTDILMMKAECQMRGVGGGVGDALLLVNPIRVRAGVPALTTLTLESLMEERRREFAGENLRWNDLMRSGLALTVMNAWAQREDLAPPFNKITRPITANLLLYPVPQAELAAVPGLYDQNPGY
ncbi:RagB/SusD family nutrient uptake outer membrane protein [Hymenobacter terricola]|uniref:RagB/SusD family nutrient uptake outer membrane protein n=1 Tax=Hymenobacter terricola TaxID=2819236 RepID=UPI001B306831|nr:RagB/SusD family nutrient uptake outer membrane protein [Hymenobacter terricola]